MLIFQCPRSIGTLGLSMCWESFRLDFISEISSSDTTYLMNLYPHKYNESIYNESHKFSLNFSYWWCTRALNFLFPFFFFLNSSIWFCMLNQDAMAHIWKSLIADSKKAIDEHLGLIFDDLLVQCGSRLWRSREASCLALADILQGRKFDQVIIKFHT